MIYGLSTPQQWPGPKSRQQEISLLKDPTPLFTTTTTGEDSSFLVAGQLNIDGFDQSFLSIGKANIGQKFK